jgi:hypothetical protein
MEKQIDMSKLPQPPQGSVFSLRKVETVSLPHPYCITPKHVAWAADHFGGMLSKDAIRDAEKHGAQCDICRVRHERLTIDQHESQMTLFVQVPDNQDLNAIPGLHKYLFENKATFEAAGIQGFAFPNPKQ